MAERTKTGQFIKGHRGIGGRPLGSRNKLSESFLKDIEKVWRKNGLKALERVAEEAPETLVRVAASLIPRELLTSMTVSATVDHNIFVDARNYVEAFRAARDYIGADPMPLIEATVEPEDEDAIAGAN